MRALGQWVVLLLLAATVGFFMVKENPQGAQHLVSFDSEQLSIAKALARGDGFADPMGNKGGDTAWTAPAGPFAMAAVFSQLEPGSETANHALLGLKALALALAAGLFWGAAKRWEASGVLFFVILFSGAVAADYDWLTRQFGDQWLVILWTGFLVFGMSNVTAGRGKFLFLLAALGTPLVSPALAVGLLMTLLVKGLFEKGSSFLILLAMLVSFGGWAYRNQQALGVPYPIISSFGFRLYQSNVLDRDGLLTDSSLYGNHPRNPASPLGQEFASWGEKEFNATYRVKAVEAIQSDQAAFQKRVIARAKNAFFFLQNPLEMYPSQQRLGADDASRLQNAGYILSDASGEWWLTLDWSEQDMQEAIGLLALQAPDQALNQWKSSRDASKARWDTPNDKARGFGLALVPIIAMLIGFLRGGLVRPAYRDPAFLYIFTLLPFVLVEHSAVQQVGMAGLQAWLVYISLFSGYLSKPRGAVSDEQADEAPTKGKGKGKSKARTGTFTPNQGEIVEIEVEDEEFGIRCYFVEILEVDKKQMRMPRPGTVLNPVDLSPGDMVTISYFDESADTHYSYSAQVTDMEEKEFLVEVPKAKSATAISVPPRDDDFKVEAEFTVMYSAHRSTHRQVGSTQAVTPNSLFLRTNLAVPPQTTLRMKLELPLRNEVEIEGKALFSEKDPNDPRKHICEVPFESIDPAGQAKMLKFAVYFQQRTARAEER